MKTTLCKLKHKIILMSIILLLLLILGAGCSLGPPASPDYIKPQNQDQEDMTRDLQDNYTDTVSDYGLYKAYGDFDADGVIDNAVGDYDEYVNGLSRAGSVSVVYNGTGVEQTWHQDSRGGKCSLWFSNNRPYKYRRPDFSSECIRCT